MKTRLQKKLYNKSISYSVRTGYEIPKFKSWHNYKHFIYKCIAKIIGEEMLKPLKKPVDYMSVARKLLVVEDFIIDTSEVS